MKIKKSIVIETMDKFVDLLLDQILKECSCSNNSDDLEFKTKSGKKVTLIAMKKKNVKHQVKRLDQKVKEKVKLEVKEKDLWENLLNSLIYVFKL
jgi:hypothetical protein